MLQADSRRPARAVGVRTDQMNEIVAICVVVVGILVFLSLISERAGGNLIGQLGSAVYSALTFLLGKFAAHIVPLLILGWGVVVYRGRQVHHFPARVAGLFIAVVSLCAIFAMPYADADLRKEEGFRIGGALGNFLMHRECLYLKGYLGSAGSYLFLVAILLISVLLITDAHLRSAATLLLAGARRLDPRRWIHYLAFWRLFSSMRFFDTLGRARLEVDDDEEAEYTGRIDDESDAYEAEDEYPAAPAPVPAPRPASAAPEPAARPAIDRDVMAVLESAERSPGRRKVPAHETAGAVSRPGREDDLLTLAEASAVQDDLPLFQPYDLPGLDLLNLPPRVDHRMSKEDIVELSETIERTLGEFGISAQVVQVTQGPTVTRFELQPAPGVKVSKILSLESDIAMCMRAESVRIIAPIPGKGAVGLEVPNRKPTPVFLRELLATDAFMNHRSPLAFALGKTISGEPYICDLAAMPHLLIAGTTGSGKSVCLNSIIVSILFRMTPEKVKFVMIDPKRVELNVYQAIPQLLAPVVSEPRKAAAALSWAVEQMEDRYKRLAALGVRNIDGYNSIACSAEPHPKAMGRHLEYMQHIVIVIDELADLMLIARNEVEDNIIRLAQMSRAVGMHLIIATQRPSVNVITGIIKANFPSRVAFQVSSKVDSRTILDANGAEALLGRGDMLFSPGGMPKPIRLQGCFVTDQEVERCADFVRQQQRVTYMKQDFMTQQEKEAALAAASGQLAMDGVDADDSEVPMCDEDGDGGYDYSFQQQRRDGKPVGDGGAGSRSSSEDGEAIDEQLFNQAVKLILTYRKASVSLLQRKLKIGFARAGRLMDMVEEAGIVGPNVGSKVREITVDPEEYLEQLESAEQARF